MDGQHLTRTPADAADPIARLMDRGLPEQSDVQWRTVAPPSNAEAVTYLSTPITTGPRLLAWLIEERRAGRVVANQSGEEIVRDEVINDNLARLVPLRARLESDVATGHLIDPTVLSVPGWGQWQYHRFWVEVLRRAVDRVVFADGWQLSTGCTIEYATALELGLPIEDSRGRVIEPAAAAHALQEAAHELALAQRDPTVALAAASRAESAARGDLKDAQLARLASEHNVASFVSCTPGAPYLRFQVLPGQPFPRHRGLAAAVERLLATSKSGSVNVRTFKPGVPKGNPFHYGLRTVAEALDQVAASAADGYYCIVNETIDIHDGGVSGVSLGGVVEFAPDDTPRAVEQEDAARLPLEVADRMLRTVYGGAVSIPAGNAERIEFSVHPVRVGQRQEPVIVWETEPVEPTRLDVDIRWPNRFSRLLGDKTFGLLVADALELPVPEATVVSRRVAPFRFGRPTGTSEWWMRTAPADQTPGHFSTTRGWTDPFATLMKEDHDYAVAAVLAQEGVDGLYSGATLPTSDGADHIIEGVAGSGDDFMLGSQATAALPDAIVERVRDLLATIESRLGSGVRIEWVADQTTIWVLQLHRVALGSVAGVFSPGEADEWLPFDPSRGLDALHELIEEATHRRAGIEVTKPVGLTSHVGDLLRKARVPGRLRATVTT